jgi:hypothetical protein
MEGVAGTQGKQKTARNMIYSLGVTIVAGLVMWAFVPHDDGEPELQRVDYRVELLTARRAAPYPVAAPEGLTEDWKPTSVRYQGADSDTWHLGFHTADGDYVQVRQSTGKPAAFIEEASLGATATGTTERLGGRTWTRYEGGRYDALVLKDTDGVKGATTVVSGTASFARLEKMAAALKMA